MSASLGDTLRSQHEHKLSEASVSCPPSLQNVDLASLLPSKKADPRASEEACASTELLNPDADPQLLAKDFWHVYRDPDVENAYVVFSLHNKAAVAVANFASSFIFLFASFYPRVGGGQNRPLNFTMAMTHAIQGTGHLFLVFYVKHKAKRSPQNHAWAKKCAEALGVMFLLCAWVTAYDIYPRGKRCYDWYLTWLDEPSSRHYCLEQIWPYPIFYMLIPLTFVDIRWKLVAPCIVMLSAMIFIGRSFHIAIPDTWGSFGAKFATITVLTVGILMGLKKLDKSLRQRFEAWVMMERNIRRLAARRNIVDQSLRQLIPTSYLNKLMMNEPVVHTSDRCSIGVTQVFDFARWSYTLLPRIVVDTIDTFFTMLDKVTKSFGVDKVKTVGDRYITSQGLTRKRSVKASDEELGDRTEHDPSMLVHMALWCVSVTKHIEMALGAGCSFELQISVHTGPCVGAIIGTQSLSYEVFGECFEGAMRNVMLCPANAIILSDETYQLVKNSFICVPNDFEQYPEDEDHPTYLAMGADPTQPPNFPDPNEEDEEKHVPASFQDVSGARREFVLRRVASHRGAHQRWAVRKKSEPDNRSIYLAGLVDEYSYLNSTKAISDLEAEFHQQEQQKWSLAFPNPKTEEKFQNFCDQVVDPSGTTALSSFAFAIIAFVMLFDGWMQDANTSLSVAIAISSIVVMGLRTYVVRVRHMPNFELFTGALAIFNAYNTAYWMEPCVVNGSTAWIFGVTSACGFFFFRRRPWTNIAGGTVINCVFLYCGEYLYRGFLVSSVGFPSFIYGIAIIGGSFISERRARNHFKNLIHSKISEEAAEKEYLLQTTLLNMIIPAPIVHAAIQKCSGGRRAIVYSLGDVCVAALRFENLSSSLSDLIKDPITVMHRVERHFQLVDEAISRTKYVSKTQCLGDRLLLAGPLRLPEPDSEDTLPQSTTANFDRQQQSESGPEKPVDTVLMAAMELLDVVWNLMAATPIIPMTAILHYGSGYAAVTGTQRPNFDIHGLVTRTANELLWATNQYKDSRFVGVHDAFAKLLSDGRCDLPRHANDFELGPRARWRLSGCGVVYVRPLYFPKVLPPLEHPLGYGTDELNSFGSRSTVSSQGLSLTHAPPVAS